MSSDRTPSEIAADMATIRAQLADIRRRKEKVVAELTTMMTELQELETLATAIARELA